jgi:hypothetical protein
VPVQGTLISAHAKGNIFLANHGGNARQGRGRWLFITRFLVMDVILCNKHLSETGSTGQAKSAFYFCPPWLKSKPRRNQQADRGICSKQSYWHLQQVEEAVITLTGYQMPFVGAELESLLAHVRINWYASGRKKSCPTSSASRKGGFRRNQFRTQVSSSFRLKVKHFVHVFDRFGRILSVPLLNAAETAALEDVP